MRGVCLNSAGVCAKVLHCGTKRVPQVHALAKGR